MNTRRLALPLLALVLASLSCTVSGNLGQTPTPLVVTPPSRSATLSELQAEVYHR
jgi:hypothetical protein